MRKVFPLAFLLCIQFVLQAQQKPANTYAVVVGISKYENPGIPSLQFAHRDAQEFANYLQTKAGGNVPQSHIRLLISDQATTAAVYDALQWIMNVAAENDLVYFYFAGHGDMENTTIYKLGFLLTYNTPANNYINNSIRLEDLNNFANTLSAGKKAKVVLITDACHSGKLAGSGYRGNLLVGNQLRTTVANEIRITSCSPEELSNESEEWGGGRGVFSFYLINGLIGYADVVKDGYVRLNEIKKFVDSAVAVDPVLKTNNVKQTPVIPVNNRTVDFVLSTTDTSLMNKQAAAGISMTMMAPLPVTTKLTPETLVTYFFQRMEKIDVSKMKDLKGLLKIPASAIPVSFVQLCLKDANTLDIAKGFKGGVANYYQLLQQLEEALKTNEEARIDFKNRMVMLLHTQTQQVINDYLEGSEAELERRRYYNAGSNGYDIYPVMLQIAMRLMDEQDFLYHIMEVNRYYFEGVALMLQFPIAANPVPLIELALQLEMKALQLEPSAAYIYDALGVIYRYKNNLQKAEQFFLKAKEIAPQWALPYSKLMGLYIQKKQYAQAQAMYDTAFALQPTLQGIYTNRGMLAEKLNNFLLAEELQRKSIQLNSRHYYPFERLGYIYTKTTNYAVADSFFYEADVRKKGFRIKPFNDSDGDGVIDQFDTEPNTPCLDTSKIILTDALGYFNWGMIYFEKGDDFNAEKKWKHVIELDQKNPLVFHYLGIMMYRQKRRTEADLMFNFAVKYYIPSDSLFTLYVRSLMTFSYPDQANCIGGIFQSYYYAQTEDHYFLAKIYEEWNHYTQAEAQYRKIIELTPGFSGPYRKLWEMMTKLGRYEDAESVILKFREQDHMLGDNELNFFYTIVTQQFPGNGYWHLKAGQFLYHHTVNSKKEFPYDQKVISADRKVPVNVKVIDQVYEEISEPEYLPGTGEYLKLANPISKPYTDGIHYLIIADSLLGADESLSSDINDKTGDLYLWQGLPAYAAVHYQKSVDLLPQNSGVRLKLIDVYDGLYQFSNALVHLDSLNKRKELNFDKMVLLSKYFIHLSKFEEAKSKLDSATLFYPYKYPALLDLYGRLYLLSNMPQKAIDTYLSYLQLCPNDSSVMYSISRLYMQIKNKAKALEWLQKALNNGFNYSWVLRLDPLMNELRNSSKWNKMMSDVPFKIYPPPANSY